MTTTPTRHPGFARQSQYRTAFRVLTFVCLAAAATCIGIAGHELFTLEGFEEPTKFWLFFIGIPLLAVAGWCAMAGFGGVAARYSAGETMPVVRDSVSYLTDGQGLLGVGRSVADVPATATGPYCSSCGQRQDAEARFCDACGKTIATT